MTNIRLPDPFTHPGQAPGFLTAPLIDNEPLIQDELPGCVVKQVNTAKQFWSTKISYPELYEDEYRLVMTAILEAKRTNSKVDIILPQYTDYRVFGDTDLMQIAPGQKGNLLSITGMSKMSGRPYVGDLFKLSTHAKIYKITNINVSGDTITIGLYPNLMLVTNGTEKPIFNNVPLQCVLMDRSNFIENKNADGLYTDISFSFRESM